MAGQSQILSRAWWPWLRNKRRKKELSGPLGKYQLQDTRGWQRIASFCSLSGEVPVEKLRIYESGLINRLSQKFRSGDPLESLKVG